MVQKIHPQGVIWVPSSRLMWAGHQKHLIAVPSIYKEVHALCYEESLVSSNLNSKQLRFHGAHPNVYVYLLRKQTNEKYTF